MKKIFIAMFTLPFLALGSCTPETTTSGMMPYKKGFENLSSVTIFGTGTEKAEELYLNLLDDIGELQKKYSSSWTVTFSGESLDEALASYDEQALEGYDDAVAAMQGLLDEFETTVASGDFGKGSFELVYVYKVSRDKVLAESEEFTFAYSGSNQGGQEPDPDLDPEPSGPAKFGDYYYSDGTWSTELDPSKTVIGVVFWTGDPTGQDPTLKKDHPECTNGLALAINGEEFSTWQSNFSAYGERVDDWVSANTSFHSIATTVEPDDHFNQILGYNHTKAIEAFNAAQENSGWPVDAVQKAVEYRSAVPAPSSSSDWYLPSPKEIFIICNKDVDNIFYYTPMVQDNMLELNKVLATIDGAQQLGTDELSFYRTSAEASYYDSPSYKDKSYSMSFTVATISTNSKTFEQSLVRFVLAF